MSPLHASCNGLVFVALSMAEETGQLAHTIQIKQYKCHMGSVTTALCLCLALERPRGGQKLIGLDVNLVPSSVTLFRVQRLFALFMGS